MASPDENTISTCGICLGPMQTPKFLQCFHSFCLHCLEDLMQNTAYRNLRCPKCRAQTEVPEGDVAKLQTNFYIQDHMLTARCSLHPQKKLEFVCIDCNVSMCYICRVTTHYKHDARGLEEYAVESRQHLKRFSRYKDAFTQQKTQVRHKITTFNERHSVIKRIVNEHAEQVKCLFKEAVDEHVQNLVITMERSSSSYLQKMKTSERCIDNKIDEVENLQQELTNALTSATENNLQILLDDMRNGRGSEQQLGQLTADLPNSNVQIVVIPGDARIPLETIIPWLDSVKEFISTPLELPMTICKVLCCRDDPQNYVHAICTDNRYNELCVAIGTKKTAGKGSVLKYKVGEENICTLSDKILGRVCLVGLNEGYVRVEGKDFPAKDGIIGSLGFEGNKSAIRKYDVYNKGDARFVLRVHESGLCDLRSTTITGSTKTTDVKVCELSAKTPIAMDVSEDGRLIAVLEEGQDHVMLYRHDNSEPHLIYRSQAEAFRPLDVCFYMIGGEERLMIADWLNDVLHVVEVGESCTLIGHVGGECPELLKPTALCAGRDGCLWIGCQGGHIFTLKQL